MTEDGRDWYILPVNPEPWEIGPLSVGRKNGRMIPIVGRDQQLFAYKEAIKEALQAAGPVMRTGTLKMSIWFWRVQATYQTHQARTHRKHEADCTNMFKATEDACQGILYKNDKDNVETHGYVVAQGPDVTPMVVICLELAPADRESEIINMMTDAVYESFQLARMLATAEGLLDVNTELAEEDDPTWEPGEF